MSNLPCGVSDDTQGAPWNDVEKTVRVRIVMDVPVAVKGPRYTDEACIEAAKDELSSVIDTLDVDEIHYEVL